MKGVTATSQESSACPSGLNLVPSHKAECLVGWRVQSLEAAVPEPIHRGFPEDAKWGGQNAVSGCSFLDCQVPKRHKPSLSRVGAVFTVIRGAASVVCMDGLMKAGAFSH